MLHLQLLRKGEWLLFYHACKVAAQQVCCPQNSGTCRTELHLLFAPAPKLWPNKPKLYGFSHRGITRLTAEEAWRNESVRPTLGCRLVSCRIVMGSGLGTAWPTIVGPNTRAKLLMSIRVSKLSATLQDFKRFNLSLMNTKYNIQHLSFSPV